MIDKLHRAYAVLELAPGASLKDVRQRYRALVKRWHPDQYSSDPAGQSEAAVRMREVNLAYQTILSALNVKPSPVEEPASTWQAHSSGEAPAPVSAHDFTGVRLTRGQIEAIVDSVRPSWELRINWRDPWNVGFTLYATLCVALVSARSWFGPPSSFMPVRQAVAPIGILVLVLLFLPMIWWGDRVTRVFGGFLLLLFTVLLPGFAVLMAAIIR